MEQELETWVNNTSAKVYIKRFSGDGHREEAVMVGPGKKILLTPRERKLLTSDRVVSAEYDPFSNGTFTPVELVESSKDLVENPNPAHKSESELVELFDERNHMAFKKSLKQFDSATTLRTMASLIEDGTVDATMGQVKAINERIQKITGVSEVSEIDQVASVGGSSVDDEDRSGVLKFRGV